MAREFFCAYHSFLKSIEPLNDAERGRLFTACLQYSETGVEPELRGNERFVFPTIRGQIDRDIKNYEEKCRINSEKGKMGGRPKNPDKAKKATAFSESQKSQDKNKDKDEDEEIPPKSPAGGLGNKKPEKSNKDELNLIFADETAGLSASLKKSALEWLEYKKQLEKKPEPYVPDGLKKLLQKLKKCAELYGDTAVISVIDDSMANNYKGIIWDKLKQAANPQNTGHNPNNPGATGNPFWDMYAEEVERSKTK